MTKDEMAGWHHRLDVHEFEWTLGDGDGQGGLVCCNSWGPKELDMTDRLNWTLLKNQTLLINNKNKIFIFWFRYTIFFSMPVRHTYPDFIKVNYCKTHKIYSKMLIDISYSIHLTSIFKIFPRFPRFLPIEKKISCRLINILKLVERSYKT